MVGPEVIPLGVRIGEAEQRIVLAREAGVWRIVTAQVVRQRARATDDHSGR
jgi:hypothetical protein